jgi:hypothetical protein
MLIVRACKRICANCSTVANVLAIAAAIRTTSSSYIQWKIVSKKNLIHGRSLSPDEGNRVASSGAWKSSALFAVASGCAINK